MVLASLAAVARADGYHFASIIDLGPVAIAEARRAMLADIEDWKDDRTAIRPRRIIACALSGDPEGLLGAIRTLPMLSAPLHLPLSELADKVPFTAAERQVLSSLMGRETGGLTDRIRLAIDVQEFLMQVSERLYHVAIGEQFAVSRGYPCSAYTIQTDRDTQLIQAAMRVLGLYNLLERELRD